MFFAALVDQHYLRKLLLKIYWGREKNLSVEGFFGDFFGLEQCRIKLCTSLLVTVNQDAFSYRFNAYFPMPFSERARTELVIKSSEGAGLGTSISLSSTFPVLFFVLVTAFTFD